MGGRGREDRKRMEVGREEEGRREGGKRGKECTSSVVRQVCVCLPPWQ